MIKYYTLISDENGLPKLDVDKQLNVSGKDASIEDTVRILNKYFKLNKLAKEHSMLVAYNSQCDIIGIFTISIGNTTDCFFYNNIIAKYLLLVGAEQFAIFHNHIYGNPVTPSNNDYNTKNNAKILSDIIKVDFVGSVIITKDDYLLIEEQEELEIEWFPEITP